MNARIFGRKIKRCLIEFFLAAAIFIALAFVLSFRRKGARRRTVSQPFPDAWRRILHDKVQFFRNLNEADKERFEGNVQWFLADTRITGIKTEVTDSDRLLVAASAVIPIFGFDEWDYDNLNEVLLYPSSFSMDFGLEGEGCNVLGMVGTGVMNNVMILSKPALHQGFSNARDKKNVGIHEFVHLLDKADGSIDGIPAAFIDNPAALPWLDMIQRKTADILARKSDINSYGATNRQEFFAVASEYFFERPKLLKQKHPELYKALSKVFKQDMAERFRKLLGRRKGVGRNAPCPCGSGEKYKRCCLR